MDELNKNRRLKEILQFVNEDLELGKRRVDNLMKQIKQSEEVTTGPSKIEKIAEYKIAELFEAFKDELDANIEYIKKNYYNIKNGKDTYSRTLIYSSGKVISKYNNLVNYINIFTNNYNISQTDINTIKNKFKNLKPLVNEFYSYSVSLPFLNKLELKELNDNFDNENYRTISIKSNIEEVKGKPLEEAKLIQLSKEGEKLEKLQYNLDLTKNRLVEMNFTANTDPAIFNDPVIRRQYEYFIRRMEEIQKLANKIKTKAAYTSITMSLLKLNSDINDFNATTGASAGPPLVTTALASYSGSGKNKTVKQKKNKHEDLLPSELEKNPKTGRIRKYVHRPIAFDDNKNQFFL